MEPSVHIQTDLPLANSLLGEKKENKADDTNLAIKVHKGYESVIEGYKSPDRFVGIKSGEIPSPFSYRTDEQELGGRFEVWGNCCFVDSNLKPYLIANKEDLWYKDVKEYYCFDGKVRKKTKQLYNPPTREKGDIKGLSPDSKRRLQRTVNKVDFKNREMPYWITLTYPQRFPTDPEEFKADLDAFLKRLKRKFGVVEYLWRLEFQKRGAPHYHFIIFLPNWKGTMYYLRKWISLNWFEVAQRFWDVKDKKHLRAGTNCKRVNNYRQLIGYVSNYMAKCDSDSPQGTGRVWGSSRNWGDHIASVMVSGYGLVRLCRIIRKYVKSQGSHRMAKYLTKNPNTAVFLPWSVIIQALDWIEET